MSKVAIDAFMPGLMRVDINVASDMSYSAASDLDELLEETLTPIALVAAKFDTSCDDNVGYFWVGEHDSVALADSRLALQEITEALTRLTADDRDVLIAQLSA